MDDKVRTGRGVPGAKVGVENGSRMYSRSPSGVVMDSSMCSFWRWGQGGVREGFGEEVSRDGAICLALLLPLLSFFFHLDPLLNLWL